MPNPSAGEHDPGPGEQRQAANYLQLSGGSDRRVPLLNLRVHPEMEIGHVDTGQ